MNQLTNVELPQLQMKVEQECLALNAMHGQLGTDLTGITGTIANATQSIQQGSQMLNGAINNIQSGIGQITQKAGSVLSNINTNLNAPFNALGTELSGIVSEGMNIPSIGLPTFPNINSSGLGNIPFEPNLIMHANNININNVNANENDINTNKNDENIIQQLIDQLYDYFNKYYDIIHNQLPAYIEAIQIFNNNLKSHIFKLQYIVQIISDQIDRTRVVTIAQIENNIGQAQANAIVERERIYDLYKDNEEKLTYHLNIINTNLITELDNNTTILQLLRQIKSSTNENDTTIYDEYIEENIANTYIDDEEEAIDETEKELQERNAYIDELVKEATAENSANIIDINAEIIDTNENINSNE